MQTWTTKTTLARIENVLELPVRIKTRCGNGLLRLPDICRVNGKLCISNALMERTRRRIAIDMQRRIDQITRDAMGLSATYIPMPATALTMENFRADMKRLGL